MDTSKTNEGSAENAPVFKTKKTRKESKEMKKECTEMCESHNGNEDQRYEATRKYSESTEKSKVELPKKKGKAENHQTISATVATATSR